MKSTLVGVLFLCILFRVVVGDIRKSEMKNYGITSTDAGRLLTYRFGIDEKFERHNKSFANETANKTTPNVSESEVVSFVDNSTQIGTNGTKKVHELAQATDGMLNVTMENVQGIKMDDLEENSTQIASLADDSTQIGKNGNESTQLIDLKYNDDELVNHIMENATEIKKEDYAEDSTQNEPSFLAQNEKYVKVENKILEFLNDATVNITVENDQLKLSIIDNNIMPGEQRNSMKYTNAPNDPPAISTCDPDSSQGYWTVKTINKGDRTVTLSDVEMFKGEGQETAMATGTIIGIVVGCAAFVALGVGGFLFWWFCYHKKEHKDDVEANIKGTQNQNPAKLEEEVGKKKEAVAPGLDSSKVKKEGEKVVKDEKLDKKEPKKEVRYAWLIRDKPDMFPKSPKTVKAWEIEIKPMKKAEKKDSDEETTSKEESKQKQPKEKAKLEKKPAKKEEESKKKSIKEKLKGFFVSKKKPDDSSDEAQSKGGIKDSIRKLKAKPVEKKEDKKVADAKVEAAKPAAVVEDVDEITQIPRLTDKIKNEAEEDERILNENPTTPDHENRKKFVEARRLARTNARSFVFHHKKKIYPRSADKDKEIHANLVQKLKNFKEGDPKTWIVDSEMMTTDSIVYLTGLGIISEVAQTFLLE
uniref:Uncharacterized protein n=1 Tax=Panagrolaimus sp. JU765 TaxID=591449 RepID=A0AC34Q3C3_9BILA